MPATPVQHRLPVPKRPGRPRKDPLDRRGHHGRPELDPRVPLLITQKFVAGVRYVLWNAYHHRVAGSVPDLASSARWSGAWTTPMASSRAGLAPVFSGETYVLREAMRRFPLERCRPPRGLRVDGVG
jgi:hypothetical protein